jgi:hypothetical protein
MDYITKFYKNKVVELQEKYHHLMEDGADKFASMTDEQFEDFIKANPGAEELARKKRAEGQTRRSASKEPKNWEEREAARAKRTSEERAQRRAARESAAKAQTEKTGTKPPKASSSATAEEVAQQKAREQYAKEWAEKQRAAERAQPKPGAASAKPQAGQTAKPTQAPKSVSAGSKVTNVAKGLGKGIASFGTGLGAYFVGKGLSDVGLKAAGVKNEVVKDISGEATGGALGGVAATTAGSLMAGAGVPTAAALGAAALKGGLVGLAAYGGLKAGEAISDIEVDEKGTTVSDVAGKGIYDIYGKMIGKGTSAEQLNTKPTGVVGGDPSKKAQYEAEEAAEKLEKEQEMEKRKAAIRAKRKI